MPSKCSTPSYVFRGPYCSCVHRFLCLRSACPPGVICLCVLFLLERGRFAFACFAVSRACSRQAVVVVRPFAVVATGTVFGCKPFLHRTSHGKRYSIRTVAGLLLAVRILLTVVLVLSFVCYGTPVIQLAFFPRSVRGHKGSSLLSSYPRFSPLVVAAHRVRQARS